jgi:GNAT superfamily N-acetyltransferase
MADAGLFIGWGEVVRGREQRALEVFNESVAFYGRLQGEGRIENFEICLLQPHGGDLAGFVLMRGSEEQMDAIQHDDEFQRITTRANFIVDNLGVVPAALGEGIGRQLAVFESEMGALA